MDWSRLGAALVDLEVENLKLFRRGWPRFDGRYYADVDAALQRWLSETREAGVASSTGLVIGLVWLYGFAAARLPSPWRQFFAVSALLWTLGTLQGRSRNT
jgi:hypothetical protein